MEFCIIVQNFIELALAIAEIWWFNDYQYGGSAILDFENFNFWNIPGRPVAETQNFDLPFSEVEQETTICFHLVDVYHLWFESL